jgi:hypothetical protein
MEQPLTSRKEKERQHTVRCAAAIAQAKAKKQQTAAAASSSVNGKDEAKSNSINRINHSGVHCAVLSLESSHLLPLRPSGSNSASTLIITSAQQSAVIAWVALHYPNAYPLKSTDIRSHNNKHYAHIHFRTGKDLLTALNNSREPLLQDRLCRCSYSCASDLCCDDKTYPEQITITITNVQTSLLDTSKNKDKLTAEVQKAIQLISTSAADPILLDHISSAIILPLGNKLKCHILLHSSLDVETLFLAHNPTSASPASRLHLFGRPATLEGLNDDRYILCTHCNKHGHTADACDEKHKLLLRVLLKYRVGEEQKLEIQSLTSAEKIYLGTRRNHPPSFTSHLLHLIFPNTETGAETTYAAAAAIVIAYDGHLVYEPKPVNREEAAIEVVARMCNQCGEVGHNGKQCTKFNHAKYSTTPQSYTHNNSNYNINRNYSAALTQSIHSLSLSSSSSTSIHPSRRAQATALDTGNTRVCSTWKFSGACEQHEQKKCRWNHPTNLPPPPPIDLNLCKKFYFNDTCTYGNRCKFPHLTPAEVAAQIQLATATNIPTNPSSPSSHTASFNSSLDCPQADMEIKYDPGTKQTETGDSKNDKDSDRINTQPNTPLAQPQPPSQTTTPPSPPDPSSTSISASTAAVATTVADAGTRGGSSDTEVASSDGNSSSYNTPSKKKSKGRAAVEEKLPKKRRGASIPTHTTSASLLASAEEDSEGGESDSVSGGDSDTSNEMSDSDNPSPTPAPLNTRTTSLAISTRLGTRETQSPTTFPSTPTRAKTLPSSSLANLTSPPKPQSKEGGKKRQ